MLKSELVASAVMIEEVRTVELQKKITEIELTLTQIEITLDNLK